jgi:hypothetical protein
MKDVLRLLKVFAYSILSIGALSGSHFFGYPAYQILLLITSEIKLFD